MNMLAEEVTELEDYGYFIDIDNGAIISKCMIDRREYKFIEKDHTVYDKKNAPHKNGNTSLFCFNTICCIAMSILFIKMWASPTKN
jgi:hypothetical protein